MAHTPRVVHQRINPAELVECPHNNTTGRSRIGHIFNFYHTSCTSTHVLLKLAGRAWTNSRYPRPGKFNRSRLGRSPAPVIIATGFSFFPDKTAPIG